MQKTKNCPVTVETIKSPSFKEDVDPIEALKVIDHLIDRLTRDASDASIYAVRETMRSYELITIVNGDTNQWITEPFIINKTTRTRSLPERITHLIKSHGEWKGKISRHESIETKTRSAVPLIMGIDDYLVANKDNLKSPAAVLIVALMAMHKAIEHMIGEGIQTLGLFHAPTGVYACNQLDAWLKNHESTGAWSENGELRVITLDDVALNVELVHKPDCQKEPVAQ